MDSGNSTGSLQSSSGGDEEYDSRAHSVSAFFNNPPPTHIFHPSSNFLDPIQRSPSILNLDSRPGRSEPNPADLGGLINPCNSSSPQTQRQNQAFLSTTQLAGQTGDDSAPNFAAPESSAASRGLLLSVSAPTDPIQTKVVRNPKKRSRASRRAPTTVLTTDTTNFRAMVQEFTGIPAPPFTSSSSFPRTRLDLFANSATTSSVRSPHPLPYSNLLRPFPHKHPFVSSLPAFPSTLHNHNDITLPSDSTSNSNSNFYHHPSSDLGLLNMNMHNPLLNFPPAHQLQPLPPPNSSFLPSKTQAQGSLGTPTAADHSNLKMGVLEEFGLNHVHGDTDTGTNVSGLQNMVSTSSEWARRRGANDDGDGGVVRSVSGNLSNSERIRNGKANYSDFHGDKGPECVAARSEGMVESWINCSSD